MIAKIATPLFFPFYSLCGFVFVFWASVRKPHPLTLEQFGIRVVAPKDYGSWDNHGEIYNALVLLKRFDEEKLELVKKYIRIVFLCTIKNERAEGGRLPTGRVCLLDLQKFADCSAGMIPIQVAGMLVRFASLAKYKKGYKEAFWTSDDVRKICMEEQRLTIEKLIDCFCK